MEGTSGPHITVSSIGSIGLPIGLIHPKMVEDVQYLIPGEEGMAQCHVDIIGCLSLF